MLRGTAREAAAEFLGTAVLLAFGSAVVAQVVLSGQTHGGYLSINIAWGLAVTMGVYVAGGVSGAHLNPAVTLAVAVHRDFAWSKVLPYMAAQIAGAFTGAAVTFLTYRAAFDRFDGGTRQVTGAKATAGIFATYPQDFLRTFPDGLIDQAVGRERRSKRAVCGLIVSGDRLGMGENDGGLRRTASPFGCGQRGLAVAGRRVRS